MGFRIGDLNVYKTTKKAETIVVRCHTTKKDQSDLVKSIFANFGQVSISKNSSDYHINCYLNDSFQFLLSKNSWSWVKKDFKSSIAFVAGYTDAEGSFLVNQNRARFKVDSYDFEILKWISKWLLGNEIKNNFRLISKKGTFRYNTNLLWNKDLWRLEINSGIFLYEFIKLILPFLRHPKRIKNAKACLVNIKRKIINGTIK